MFMLQLNYIREGGKLMKVQQNQNQQSFGMALYMPSQAKIAKKLGTYAAGEAEKTREVIKELAKDVDIYVKPEKSYSRDVRLNKLRFTVTNIGKNPISRFFNRNNGKNTSTYVSVCEEPFSKKIVTTLQNLKEAFLKYSK